MGNQEPTEETTRGYQTARNQTLRDVETSYDSIALGFPPHQIPQRPNMPSPRGLGTDRDPNHPAPIQRRRGQVRSPRAVDPLAPAQRVLVQRRPVQTPGIVTDADRLQGHRGEHLPAGGTTDLFGQP